MLNVDQEQSFLILSDDDFAWLRAYDKILEEPKTPRSAPIPIPSSKVDISEPNPPLNDSLTLLRTKNMPRRRHNYRSATKSSSAKSVNPIAGNDYSSHTPLHPDLRNFKMPLSSEAIGHDGKRSKRASIISRKASKESLSHHPPSPYQQSEWIYRRPKVPTSKDRTADTTTSWKRPNSRTSSRSASILPDTEKHTSSLPSNTSFWSTVFRSTTTTTKPRKDISAPILAHNRASRRDAASLTESPLCSPDNSRPTTPASACSSALSSPYSSPCTPNSIIAPFTARKMESAKPLPPLVRCTPIRMSPSKSILTRTSSDSNNSTFARRGKSGRNNSISTTTSSSAKSVKFVDEPIIHYASVGYWDHLEEGCEDMNGSMMGIDVDAMDVDSTPDVQDEPMDYTPEPASETLSRDIVENVNKDGTRSSWKFMGIERKGSSSDLPNTRKTKKSRPVISGPYTLGSFSAPSPASSVSYLSGLAHKLPATSTTRANPSVESLKSCKSTGSRKSIRSFTSLKSFTGSLRSSFTLNSKSMKYWWKDKLEEQCSQ